MSSKLQSNNPSADPAITSVVDGTGTSLGNPGTTENPELTLSGTAPASTLVIVVDNLTEPGYRVLVEAGTWKLDKLPVAVGLHSLTVQTLADSILEAPKIVQAPDDLTLDVSALSGDVDLTVKPWPLIAAGQQISLRFEGTKADGSPYCWLHPIW